MIIIWRRWWDEKKHTRKSRFVVTSLSIKRRDDPIFHLSISGTIFASNNNTQFGESDISVVVSKRGMTWDGSVNLRSWFQLGEKKGDPMGGGAENGHGGDFRAKVWSMSGGPYCRPKHWRRNTAFAMLGVFLVCIPIAMKSAELEVFILLHFFGPYN